MIDTFASELRRVFRLWGLCFNEEMRTIGHGRTGGLALLYIREAAAPLTQKELAKLLLVEEPTLARLLDTLEENGLVMRKVGATDRRTKQVLLTDKAVPLLEEIKKLMYKTRQQALAGIDKGDLAVAIEVIKKISENLEKGGERAEIVG